MDDIDQLSVQLDRTDLDTTTKTNLLLKRACAYKKAQKWANCHQDLSALLKRDPQNKQAQNEMQLLWIESTKNTDNLETIISAINANPSDKDTAQKLAFLTGDSNFTARLLKQFGLEILLRSIFQLNTKGNEQTQYDLVKVIKNCSNSAEFAAKSLNEFKNLDQNSKILNQASFSLLQEAIANMISGCSPDALDLKTVELIFKYWIKNICCEDQNCETEFIKTDSFSALINSVTNENLSKLAFKLLDDAFYIKCVSKSSLKTLLVGLFARCFQNVSSENVPLMIKNCYDTINRLIDSNKTQADGLMLLSGKTYLSE